MLLRTFILSSILLSATALMGCEDASEGESAATEAALSEVSVQELSSMLERDEATPVDANSGSTREENGVIPGARLLSSSSGFDLAELPEDRSAKLVFYCANTHCSASDSAAERAAEAGYEQVAVLRAGIQGWREAGKPTVPPRS